MLHPLRPQFAVWQTLLHATAVQQYPHAKRDRSRNTYFFGKCTINRKSSITCCTHFRSGLSFAAPIGSLGSFATCGIAEPQAQPATAVHAFKTRSTNGNKKQKMVSRFLRSNGIVSLAPCTAAVVVAVLLESQKNSVTLL